MSILRALVIVPKTSGLSKHIFLCRKRHARSLSKNLQGIICPLTFSLGTLLMIPTWSVCLLKGEKHESANRFCRAVGHASRG